MKERNLKKMSEQPLVSLSDLIAAANAPKEPAPMSEAEIGYCVKCEGIAIVPDAGSDICGTCHGTKRSSQRTCRKCAVTSSKCCVCGAQLIIADPKP